MSARTVKKVRIERLVDFSDAHRPWPIPRWPWLMRMTWRDLLFMHWPVAPEALGAVVPAGMQIDTFDGRAWIAVVPFRMTGVRGRCLPALPRLSDFLELNVRTYVRVKDRPGVYFFTLDANCRPAIHAARTVYHLNYVRAEMRARTDGAQITYESRRTDPGAGLARLSLRYGPAGAAYRTRSGDLDHWLTERYCLFAADRRGGIRSAEIHHAPWTLQPARAEIFENCMTENLGIRLPDAPPLLHFAERLDVVAWGPKRLTCTSGRACESA